MKRVILICFSVIVALVTHSMADHAHAYIGPGLGLGSIAVVLGMIGAVFLAIFAIIWYPLKRVLRKRPQAKEQKDDTAEEHAE